MVFAEAAAEVTGPQVPHSKRGNRENKLAAWTPLGRSGTLEAGVDAILS